MRGAPPDVAVSYERGADDGGAPDALRVEGGHKTVRWSVRADPPRDGTITARLRVRGGPPSFGLSLTQGYFVEPLISVAAARTGVVLLPAAGIVNGGRTVVLLGRSRTGKSSVTARALAAGRPVLGDDQVLIDSAASAWPFWRRLRFYSDLSVTAPLAYARLSRSTRFALGVRRWTRAATRGFVAPPVRVQSSALGRVEAAAVPLGRVVLITRGGSAPSLDGTPLGVTDAVENAMSVLREQRSKLTVPPGTAWADELERTVEQERRILTSAFAAVPLERVDVPHAWPAERAIPALEEWLVS